MNLTSFAGRRRETHHFVAAALIGMCLAVVVWVVVGGALLQRVRVSASPRGSDATLALLAIALSVTGVLLLGLRASKGRLIPEAVAAGAAFGLVVGNLLIIAVVGLIRFYPSLP